MLASAALLAVLAKPNLALRFDGNAIASIADCPALRLKDEMTFQAWVFLEQPIVGRTFAYLLSKNYAGTGYEVTVLDRPHHRLSTADFAGLSHDKKPSLPIAKWTHIAYARSLNRAKLYVDGELVLETPTGIPFTENDVPLYIGSSNFLDQAGGVCRFIGSLDEVQIWNVARSQGNIRRSMFVRPSGHEKSLVVYLPFDEGKGQALENVTGKTGPMSMGWSPLDTVDDPIWVAGAPLR